MSIDAGATHRSPVADEVKRSYQLRVLRALTDYVAAGHELRIETSGEASSMAGVLGETRSIKLYLDGDVLGRIVERTADALLEE